MNFAELYALVESKGTKPGERLKNVKNSNGPSGISSSPIGKSDYNPELPDKINNGPSDKGSSDSASVIGLLGKSFQILKNDEVFQDQMKGIMNGFKRNRHQISGYQESVLKSKPKTIDNSWGEINRLIKVVNNPDMKNRSDYADYVAELDEARINKDKHQAELDKVSEEVEGVAEKNEELNHEYLEQLLTVIRHTTKRLYTQHAKALEELGVDYGSNVISTNEADFDKLQKDLTKSAEAQLQLLEMLMSDDVKVNPLLIFLELQEHHYDDAKNRFYQVKNGDNYSVTIEQLYRNLPLFSLINYFSHTILKSPSIVLSKKQDKRTKSGSIEGSMIDKLGDIKTEAQYDAIKPELVSYLNTLSIPQKDQLINVANGPFISRKGAANAAVKIRSSLVSSNITESFDEMAQRLLSESSIDENDFKINLVELIGEKCTGPTKKTSSDRKNKKYMKCAKQTDGSYKKIHWGEKGVRAGGGNSKRAKAFRKRHGCANAKPGSPKAESCKNWN